MNWKSNPRHLNHLVTRINLAAERGDRREVRFLDDELGEAIALRLGPAPTIPYAPFAVAMLSGDPSAVVANCGNNP